MDVEKELSDISADVLEVNPPSMSQCTTGTAHDFFLLGTHHPRESCPKRKGISRGGRVLQKDGG